MSSMTTSSLEHLSGRASVSHFQRLRLLGSGNFGQCWLVTSKRTLRPYVMKEVRVAGRKQLEAARAEVEVQARLRHKHIVQ